jgi:hypothetical protein
VPRAAAHFRDISHPDAGKTTLTEKGLALKAASPAPSIYLFEIIAGTAFAFPVRNGSRMPALGVMRADIRRRSFDQEIPIAVARRAREDLIVMPWKRRDAI